VEDRGGRRGNQAARALRAIWSAWNDGTTLRFRGEFNSHTLMTRSSLPRRLRARLPGVLELHGWAGLADELNELSRSVREDKWTAMAGLIDDDVLNALAVVAEPGGVAPEIQRRFGGLIDRVSFYSAYDIDPGTWDPILAGLRASQG
jgi:hypothetical protein